MQRGITLTQSPLTIIEADVFSESIRQNSTIADVIKKSDYVFNCASPKISWLPFSTTNRKWGEPVSNLTKDIISLGKETQNSSHLLAFCGTEYFKEYDGTKGFMGGFLSLVLKSLIGALRDNDIEARFLLNSNYKKWTVFRCGSIRDWANEKGNSSKIGFDFHKDKSDYRKGKGKALIVEDLSAFLIDKIKSNEMNLFETKMPFVYNIEF